MPKPANVLVQEALDELVHSNYDPAKAHAYYMRNRQLKGRTRGSKDLATVVPIGGKQHKPAHKTHKPHGVPPALQARVHSLESRLNDLRANLRKLLANKSKPSAKKKTHHRDGVKEKSDKAASDKKYRQTHKSEIDQKRKARSHGGGSGGGSGGKGKKGGGVPPATPDSMTETELRSAIKKTSANLHAAVAKARSAAN